MRSRPNPAPVIARGGAPRPYALSGRGTMIPSAGQGGLVPRAGSAS